MARLEAIAKALYYPTPDRCVDMIGRVVALDAPGGSLLDPCAGEGRAASRLGAIWNLKTYGVELDRRRARIANRKMTRCHLGSYHQIDIESHGAQSGAQGVSVLFLNPPYDQGTDEDGHSARQEVVFLENLLPLVVRGGLLVYVVPRKILFNPAFREIACRNLGPARVLAFPDPERQAFDQIVLVARVSHDTYSYSNHGLEDQEPEPLESADPMEHRVPVQLVENFSLQPHDPTSEAPSCCTQEPSGAYASQRWGALTGPLDVAQDAPLLAPRQGHQAMLLAAGALNGIELDGYLLKGGSEKVTHEIEEGDKLVCREVIHSHLSVLDLRTGELDSWRVNDQPAKTERWFRGHGAELAHAILSCHPPSFDGDLSAYDFSQICAPGVLPGRTKPEILQIQKQASAAIAHFWRKNKDCKLAGEMGTGKTTISIAACELSKREGEKVVVICPSHLVPKWQRECQAITGSKDGVRTAKKISHVDAFFASDARYLIVSKETAKLGSRWRPSFVTRTVVLTHEEVTQSPFWPYERSTKVVRRRVKAVFCPDCGALQRIKTFDLSPASFDDKTKRKCTSCKAPLWTTVPLNAKGTKRWPLAHHISNRYARRYKLVLDETHMFAKPDSDQSLAIRKLVASSRKVLAMTGTLYGGRASSIFYLEHMLNWRFRQAYRFKECQKFVEQHGLFERVYDESESTSVYGYRRGRKGGRLREIPGMNPAMIPWLLPRTIFLKLRDLRLELPPYTEEVELVDHDADVHRAAQELASNVKSVLRERPQILGQYLQACLGYPDCPEQAEKIVAPATDELPEEVVGSAPAFPSQVRPKDERVVEIARAEAASGRKVLVFCTQTKRRDPRPRLRRALEAAGLRVAVLHSNVAADKREKWLRDAEKQGFDVMLTNGRLVETGMDLMFAHTIIQYGIEYSVHSLRQSIRRSWRLGQTQPIRVVFLGYRGTMQETALELIAKKMRAAEMIDGDEAGGLAQFDVGGTNFLVELAHEAIAKAKPRRRPRRKAS